MKKNNKNNDKKEVAKKILKKGLNITSYICTGLLLTLFLVSGVTSCNNKANKKQVDDYNTSNVVKIDDSPNNFYYPSSSRDYVVVTYTDLLNDNFFVYLFSQIYNVGGNISYTQQYQVPIYITNSRTDEVQTGQPVYTIQLNRNTTDSTQTMIFTQTSGNTTYAQNDFKAVRYNINNSNTTYIEGFMSNSSGAWGTANPLGMFTRNFFIPSNHPLYEVVNNYVSYYYNAGRDRGNSEGYQTGYSEGYETGNSEGYQTGYSEGYETGYSEGFEVGNGNTIDDDRYLQITINEFYPTGLLSLGLKRIGVWAAPAVDPALNQRYHSYGIVFHHVPFTSAGKEYDTILLRISKGYDTLNVRNPITGEVTQYYPENVKVSGNNTSVAYQLFFVDSLLYLKSANNNLFGSPIGDDDLSDYYEYWDIAAYNYFNGVSPSNSSENALTFTPNSYSWTDINYQNIYIDKTTTGYTNWYQASAYDSSFYNYNVEEIALKDTGGKRLSAMTDATIYATTTFPFGSKDNNVFNLLQRAFTSVIPIFETNIVAGVTIGSLIFLPLLVSIIIVVIKLLKR